MGAPKKYVNHEIKSFLGSLARPNFYMMDMALPPGDIRTFLTSRGVDRNFMEEGIGLMCNTATVPGVSLATMESYNRSGVKENFAHFQQYDTLNLEFYVDNSYRTLKYFESWIDYIGGNSLNRDDGRASYSRELRYPDEYKSNTCKLYKFENDIDSLSDNRARIKSYKEYSFVGLYPRSISPSPLGYGQRSDIMKLSVVLGYDRHIAGSIHTIDFANLDSGDLTQLLRNTIVSLGEGALNTFIN